MKLLNWLDHRTGCNKLLDALLLEHIPGGAKWRYVWGSCLVFVFAVQAITGVLLMTAYSPGDSTAWGSVYFIQYEMQFGWFIRGLHHFGSQAMVILLCLHMLQVVIAGAQLPPREVNWWLGLALLGCILGLSLTGYLLPWDQKGYWATQVATNIAGNLPYIGETVKTLLVGGPEYGNQTLTRFYALHVGVLPITVIVLVVLHIVVFRRHGVTAPKDAEGEGMFWPDQAFKDLVASLAVFGVILWMVIYGGQGHIQQETSASEERSVYDQLAYGGRDGRGANLDAPADPQETYPPRPEWYFLFLFQLLKYFEGDQILIGTVIIPNGVAVILFLLPLLGYGKMRPLGHVVGVLVVVGVLAAAAALTCLAIADDTPDPVARHLLEHLAFLHVPAIAGVLLLAVALNALIPKGVARRLVYAFFACVMALMIVVTAVGFRWAVTDSIPEPWHEHLASEVTETAAKPSERTAKAAGFRLQLLHAEERAARAVQIAHAGIPEAGGTSLLQRDPATAGKKLFVQNCGSCHSFKGASETGQFAASDLTNFGQKEWITSMLLDAGNDRFFGRTGLKGMKAWSEKHHDYRKSLLDEIAESAKKQDDTAKQTAADAQKTLDYYDAWVDRVVNWLASHPTGLPKDNPATAEEKQFKQGYDAFYDKKIKQGRCSSCHTYEEQGGSEGPDLTGYGSADWIRLMIVAPAHPMRHGSHNKMTAFRNDQGPGAEILLRELVTVARDKVVGDKYTPLADVDREMIIRFMLGDDRVVFFGRPISGPEVIKKR